MAKKSRKEEGRPRGKRVRSPGAKRQIPRGGPSSLDKILAGVSGPFLRNLFGVLIAGAIMVVMLIGPRDTIPNYRVGDVAAESYYAPFDFELVDEERTQVLRETAAARIPPFFQYDARVLANALNQLDSMCVSQGERPPPGIPGLSSLEASKSLYKPLREALEETLKSPILSSEAVQFVSSGVLTVRGFAGGSEDKQMKLEETLTPKQAAKRLVSDLVREELLEDKYVVAIRSHLDRWVQPTLIYSAGLTEAWRQRAAEEVLPLVSTYRRGQCLIRQGETFTDRSLAALKRYEELRQETDVFSGSLGKRANDVLAMLILVGLLFSLAWIASRKDPRTSEYPVSRQIVLGLALVLATAGMKASVVFWTTKTQLAYFVFSIGLLSLIVTALESWLVAVSFGFFLACLGGIMLRGQLGVAIVGGITGFFGALSMHGTKRRTDLLRVGGIMVFSAALGSFGVDLWGGTTMRAAAFDSAYAVLGAVLAVALTPIGLWTFESLFASSTDITLLELSDLRGQSILRKLDKEAPGSYEHSLVVSNLAEVAASAVGANALRAKVGALYHDIGKMNKPEYFIENLRQGKSKHSKLSPSMSALILISHVKEGVQMAQEARLPKEIVDIIQQHHGTSTISYFYQKAISQDAHGAVREDEFRYAGPKPQTAEAAVVMLADSVEAATRSLDSRSETRIRRMVKDVVNKKLGDGQLDECPLTLKDMTTIVDALARVLTAFYHGRIEYPEEPKGGAPEEKDVNKGSE